MICLHVIDIHIYFFRNGCKPFVEIFIDGERVFTSCTKDNMSSIRSFTTSDGSVEIPVGVSVCGNLHIIVHHIKSIPPISTKSAGMVTFIVYHHYDDALLYYIHVYVSLI